MSAVAEVVGSWRIALRLACRVALRAPARTGLVVVMLILPVYAATVLALSYTATYTSTDIEASWTLGRADPAVVPFDVLDRQASFHWLSSVPEGAAPNIATPSTRIAVDGPELVRAVTGAPPPREAVDVLNRGGAVVFAPELITGAVAEILPNDDAGQPVRLPAVLVRADASYSQLPGMVISAQTAELHQFTAHPGGVLFDPARPPTPAQVDAANSAALAAYVREAPADTATPENLTVGVEPSAPGRRFDTMLLVLSMVSAVMTVAAGGIAVALSVAEMRDDLSTLAAVGALPALRRRIAGAQAGLIVGLGVLLGVAAGIAPAAGMVAFRPDLRWDVPWLSLIVTALIGPLIAVVATTMLTRPRLVMVRRIR